MTGREVILAADPGLSGALAVLVEGQLAEVEDMPTFQLVIGGSNRRRVDPFTLEGLIRSLLTSYAGPLDQVHVVIEGVGPRPKDGVVQAFTFGEAYGLLCGIVAGSRLPLRTVKPDAWKRALKLRKGKDASRQRAMELFPAFRDQFGRVKDDGRAEAALIGHWAHSQLKSTGAL